MKLWSKVSVSYAHWLQIAAIKCASSKSPSHCSCLIHPCLMMSAPAFSNARCAFLRCHITTSYWACIKAHHHIVKSAGSSKPTLWALTQLRPTTNWLVLLMLEQGTHRGKRTRIQQGHMHSHMGRTEQYPSAHCAQRSLCHWVALRKTYRKSRAYQRNRFSCALPFPLCQPWINKP